MHSVELQLKTYGGKPYQPLPGQSAFHAAQATFRAFLGGRGSGKSTGGIMETVLTAVYYPGSRILVGRKTYGDLETTTWKYLRKTIPRELIAKEYTSTNKLEIYLTNGSEILGRNLQDWQSLSSLDLSAFHIDECTELDSDDCYVELIGRLRHHVGPHRGWLTGTPNGFDWVWKRFVGEANEDHFYILVDSRENDANNPAGYVDRMARNMTEDQRRQYIHAEFLSTAGLIFPMFNEDVHLVEPFPIPSHWPRYRSLDPGRDKNNPACCPWAAVNEAGDLYIYDLYYEADKMVSEQAAEILRKTGSDRIEWTAIDPYVANRRGLNTNDTLMDQYRQFGISSLIPGNGDKETSISKIQERLKYDDDTPPRLFIFDRPETRPLIQELKYWKRDRSGKPEDKNDHAISALRYLLNCRPHTAEEQGKREMHPLWRRFHDLLDERDSSSGPSRIGSQGIDWKSPRGSGGRESKGVLSPPEILNS